LTTVVTDFVCVADRALELGCQPPSSIAVLPENFATATTRKELLFGSEAATIKKVLKAGDLPVDDLTPSGERFASIHNKHFEWAPLLFISGALVSGNPHAVSVALGVISNYATDFFKGMPGKVVRLSVVVERRSDRVCKKLTYEGDVAGLSSIANAIRDIANE
jgi:hypothetical protein